jgi:hypothetical protein
MPTNQRIIVMYSGGVTSWAAAKRAVERYGRDAVTLLFADTLIEDEDLYRFLEEAAPAPLVRISEGRDPWATFFDSRFLGNHRIDPCSRILKRELMRKWLDDNCDPASTVVVLGFDWTELHRVHRSERFWAPWAVWCPLTEKPYTHKARIMDDLRAEGIAPPRLYAMGAQHNNCGGFCVKAGQGQFAWLLANMPARYAHHEAKEQQFRDFIGKDVAILDERIGGERQPLTLRELRERIETNRPVDLFEYAGCDCLVPTDDDDRAESSS